MRRILVSLSLVGALMAGASAFAAVTPITCPADVSQTNPDPVAQAADLYDISLFRGSTLINATGIVARDGEVSPASVSREQSYLASLTVVPNATGGNTTILTPGKVSDGLSLWVKPKASETTKKTIEFGITFTYGNVIKSGGPKDGPIQTLMPGSVARMCGSLVLSNGESETFQMTGTDIVVRIQRKAQPQNLAAN